MDTIGILGDLNTEHSFVVDGGPTGIDLHSVQTGRGTFVESFYRTHEGALLAAEKCEEIQIGDRLAYIDDICIFNYRIEDVRDILLSRVGSYKVTVKRIHKCVSLVELIVDPRISSWLDMYLHFYCLSREADQVVCKIRLANFMRVLVHSEAYLSACPCDDSEAAGDIRNMCSSCILYCIEQYPVNDIPESVVEIVRSLVQEAEVPFPSLLRGVQCVLDLVQRDLERTLLLKFKACVVAKQMIGWISASPKFVLVSINDLFQREDLLSLYFLFLCSLERQRHVRILLHLRRRARDNAAVECARKVHELQTRVVLEAARDELLSAFYGSPIFDAVLNVLQGRSLQEMDDGRAEPGEGERTGLRFDFLQRTLRSITLPKGISLHRKACEKVDLANSNEVRNSSGSVKFLSFRMTAGVERRDVIVNSKFDLHLPNSLSQRSSFHIEDNDDLDATEDLTAGMLQFLVPVESMTDSAPQLFSFVATQKNGSYIYGASLVIFIQKPIFEGEWVKSNSTVDEPSAGEECRWHGEELPEESAVDVSPGVQLVDLSPLDTASVESPAVHDEPVDNTFLGVILYRSQSSQTLSRVTDGAGQLLRGLRQWGELALPPHIPSVSSVSSLRSLPVSAAAVAAGTPSVYEPITPLTPSFWELGATLSGAWVRPTAQVKAPQQVLEEVESGDAVCDLWDTETSNSAQGELLSPGHFTGVALLSTRPAIDALRRTLGALEPSLPTLSDSDANISQQTMHLLSESEYMIPLLRGVSLTEDFNPEQVFEVLSAQNLTTIYMAMLLEYKIVMVSTHRRTIALLLGEWLRLAMQPLEWCHIYAPVAPQRLALELLQCPAPYVLGIARDTLRAARAVPPADAVVVDLDAGSVRAPADLKAALSAVRGLVAKLVPLLQPHYAACDSVLPPSTDLRRDLVHAEGTVGVCRSFLCQALAPVSKCTTVLAEGEELLVALDEKKFLQKASQVLLKTSDRADDKQAVELFLRQLMRAQSFSEHLLALKQH